MIKDWTDVLWFGFIIGIGIQAADAVCNIGGVGAAVLVKKIRNLIWVQKWKRKQKQMMWKQKQERQ